MARKKHEVPVRNEILDLTEVPVTAKDLRDEWQILKIRGMKRCFVSYLDHDTEYIYGFRFLKKDIEENRPVAQLAFIRTADAVYTTKDMNYNYCSGYLVDFRGGIRDFHRPKRLKETLQYAIPTVMVKWLDSRFMKNRAHPCCIRSCSHKFGYPCIPELKYMPANATPIIDRDPTYYLAYILKTPEATMMAEMLSKFGHPECLMNPSWFSLPKKEFIAMVRYAQKAKMPDWNYNTIRWNIRNGRTPEKSLDTKNVKNFGMIKKVIPWATTEALQKETLNYLTKQKQELHIYQDYLRLREELGIESESHSARFPSNLWKAHDRLVEEQVRRNEEKIRQEEAEEDRVLKAMADKITITDGRYTAKIPGSKEDFRVYGKIMDDCLCMAELWSSKVVGQQSFIFILCTPEEGPYLACEVRRPKKKLMIEQLYLRHNKVPDRETARYVRKAILPQLEGQVLLGN